MEQITLTDEQMEALRAFDAPGKAFRTVLEAGYVRQLSRQDADLMLRIYREASGKRNYAVHWGCGACGKNFVTMLARIYRANLATASARKEAAHD